MTHAASWANPLAWLGALGRRAAPLPRATRDFLSHLSGVWALLVLTCRFSALGLLRPRLRLREQLFPTMKGVGVRSFPIVCLIAVMSGAILVLQTGDVMKRYGQLQEVPGLVALSMARELGPLMTAIILIARVGASFTAVIASMKINDEVMALETMAIHPVGYLVAPRFLSMVVMGPCLTVFSFLVGMAGGAVVANGLYDIALSTYVERTVFYLRMKDILSGLAKAEVFAVIISMVSCYWGMIAGGGPMGLGRNIMVAVVTALVTVSLADVITTAFFVNYVF